MEDPRNIIPAIDLLVNEGRSKRLPWWLTLLDYALGATIVLLWYGSIAFIVYKLVKWL